MTFKEKVQDLLNEKLKETPKLFLINLTVTDSNKIIVTLDGDTGVQLQDCVAINRHLENELSESEIDYSIEVASAGVSTPLKTPRQFKKNIGRTLKLRTKDNEYQAVLTNTTDQTITIEWAAREPKKIGKGKETVLHNIEIKYIDIEEAIVTIIF